MSDALDFFEFLISIVSGLDEDVILNHLDFLLGRETCFFRSSLLGKLVDSIKPKSASGLQWVTQLRSRVKSIGSSDPAEFQGKNTNLLGLLALECLVKDDVSTLFHLLVVHKVSLEFKCVSEGLSAFPFFFADDSFATVSRRFPCFWCSYLLTYWRASKNAAPERDSSSTEKRRLKALSSFVSRRGSYAIMKRDLVAAKGEDLMLHFHLEKVPGSAAGVVTMNTSSAKKARHLVYELGEKFGLDLEAWALKNKNDQFLDDYKSLLQNEVRSGDELFVELKHKALQEHKSYSFTVYLMASDASYVSFVCAVDPFTPVGSFLGCVKKHISAAGNDDLCLMLPMVGEKKDGSLGGIWLQRQRTFASYGLADNYWESVWGQQAQKPLLMGTRASILKFTPRSYRESDPRINVWLEIISHFADYRQTSKKRMELDVALAHGIPACLRGRVWEHFLGINDLVKQNHGVYERLVTQDFMSTEEEIVMEKIDRDVDRTMPYHPYFRHKGGLGQTHLQQVLRAYSVYDKDLGYCQGLNFVCATLLMVFEPESAFWALTLMLGRYGLRSNFATGMKGLHDMLNRFDGMVSSQMPELFSFLIDNGIISASIATEWFLTIFTASASDPLRMMDVFFFKGANVLFDVALSIYTTKSDFMMSNPEQAMDALKTAFSTTNSEEITCILKKALKC